MFIDELMKDPWFREHATPFEHNALFEDDETQTMMNKVVDVLMKRAVEYKKMSNKPSNIIFKSCGSYSQ